MPSGSHCGILFIILVDRQTIKKLSYLRSEEVYSEQKADEERKDIEKRVGYEKRGQKSQNKGGN